MPNYRINVHIAYEFRGSSYEEAIKSGESLVDSLAEDLDISKKSLRIELLKDRRCSFQLGEFTPEEVLQYVSKSDKKRSYKVGNRIYEVKMNSHRYFVFRENLNCAACGLKGTKMILERNPSDKSPHFNLYAVEEEKLILMTKDHVIPKSVGGEDRHSNYQTMCSVCNGLKGSSNLTLDSINELRTIYNENKLLPKKKLKVILDDAKEKLETPRTNHPQKKPENYFFTNNDLNVWKDSEGKLKTTAVYDDYLEDSDHFACIKKGTELDFVSFDKGDVIVRLLDGQVLSLPQIYVKVRENI